MAKKLLKHIKPHLRAKKDLTYEVMYVDNFKDEKTLGECRPNEKQIVLKKGLSPTETFKVYLHECIHMASFEYMQTPLTEAQVLDLEEAIYKILKLNNYV